MFLTISSVHINNWVCSYLLNYTNYIGKYFNFIILNFILIIGKKKMYLTWEWKQYEKNLSHHKLSTVTFSFEIKVLDNSNTHPIEWSSQCKKIYLKEKYINKQ